MIRSRMTSRSPSQRILLAVALLTMFLGGCAEDPNPVGASLLPRSDFPVLHRDTLYALNHRSTKSFVVTNFSDMMLVGNYQTYQAWAALKFYSFPDTMIGATITSASIQLRASYRTGDSSSFSFDVRRATGYVLRDSLTLDSLLLRPGDYMATSPIVSLSSLAPMDTGVITINLAIADTSMLNRWFSSNADSISGNDGIILQPTGLGPIHGFSTYYASESSFRPTLTVHYTKNGVSGTYTHAIDSARSFTKVDESSLLSDPARVVIQNGISYRGFITFDISRIPNPSLVSLVTLDLTQDAAGSRFTWLSHDSLYAGLVNTDGTLSSSIYRLSDLVTDSSGRIHYQFNATSFVQTWMKQSSLPRTVSLTGLDETGTLDLCAVFGSSAPDAIRPKLIITYSTTR